MGLDITAISEIKPIEVPEGIEKYSDEYYDWENELNVGHLWGIWFNPSFPTQQEGLPEADTVFSEGEEYGFRAGSYSGYGEWRDTLAKVGASFPGGSYEAWENEGGDYPFEELINFSDAEGYIAAPVTDKLCQDFVNLEEDVIDIVDKAWLKIHPTIELTGNDKDWFLAKWNDWKGAMCTASQDGAVMWH